MTDPTDIDPTPPALWLAGDHYDRALIGGKAAAIDDLLAWKIPVPPAGAITTTTYRALAATRSVATVIDRIKSGESIDSEQVDAAFLDAALPADAAAALTEVVRDVGGGGPVAVRSSATVEDMAESSFAGQYRSVLDVDSNDPDVVLGAVKLVFASLWHPAPCTYRRALGIDETDVAMGALVMSMVNARRAGVVFTADPGGDPSLARVEAVDGLGESLVSGERTPDAYLVARDSPADDLPDEVRAAFEWSMAIEKHTGQAHDVEWAWDGDSLWVVQARPITVIVDGDGFDDDPGDHDLTTAGIGEMLPGVLPPLRWQVGRHMLEQAFREVLDELDLLPEDVSEYRTLIRRVRGRAALDFSRLKQMAEAVPGGAAEELEYQYFGSRRPGRAAAPRQPKESWLRTIRHDLRVVRARHHNTFDAETAIEAVATLCESGPDLAELSNPQLMTYRLGLVDLAVRAMAAELGVAAEATSAYRRIELLLLPHLGETEAGHHAEQLTARYGITAEPHADASAAVFAGPTWDELDRPPPVFRGRRATAASDADPMDELDAHLRTMPTWGAEGLRAAFHSRALHRTVADAIGQLRRRESLKAAILRLGGEVRRIHLALGHRLVATGALDQALDVELLDEGELRSALNDLPPSKPTIARRRRWLARYEAEPPLPARFTGLPHHRAVDIPTGNRLDGWAASAGRYRGRAQVVRDPGERLDAGAILVAEATDASWSPLFVEAGAIVLERGGPLSHAAILARELGVPAVLNVAGASHLDGAELTVDGDAGVVVVHAHDAEVTA